MHIDDFLTWFNSTGVNTDKVTVCHVNNSGFGLYSRHVLIEKDSLVLSIPEHLFIKPSFQTDQFTGFEQLIIHLLNETNNPYIEFLRSIECVPSWRYSPDDSYPRQLTDPMTKHQTKYSKSRAKMAQYNEDDFQWAYYTINTRCVHLDLERDSKDPDENLCLIPYLDFVNHSVEPNTIAELNPTTRCYEIRAKENIGLNEQITFLYNPHSNVDLFIEYGFVLPDNPYNQLNLDYELERILSNEQIQLMKSYQYWNCLEFYAGDNDLSWTVIKAIELTVNQAQWSPYDDPPPDEKLKLRSEMHNFRSLVQENVTKDFDRWRTDRFNAEKTVLYNDFMAILYDTSTVIDKSIVVTYLFLSI